MRGISSAPQVVQAYFLGGRLSETVRSWQARVGQRPVVQARGASNGHAFPTPPGFLKGRAQGGGQPLPATVKSQMESFFQTDFSQVRVHVGPEPSAIGALAFTVGTDLYFAPGQYQPNTQSGRQLLGHELTHVVQQQQGRVANPYGSGLAVVHDPGLEEEAEQQGSLAAKHPGRSRPAGGQVQRSTRSQAAAEKPRGVQRAGGYKLIIGAYLHPNAAQLPEPLAGHSFVSIVHPDGNKKTYGFSPAHYGSYDPRRDLSKLRAGVPGVVYSDQDAWTKPGVKLREYEVGAAQAQAALAKIEDYQSGKYRYNLTNRQCSTFALEVLRAAKVEDPSSTGVSRPRDLYRQLPGKPQIQRTAKPGPALTPNAGSNIYFTPGKFQPTTAMGEQLLARHLGRTMQPRAGMATNASKRAVALAPASVPTGVTARTGGRGSVTSSHKMAVGFPCGRPAPPSESPNRSSAIQQSKRGSCGPRVNDEEFGANNDNSDEKEDGAGANDAESSEESESPRPKKHKRGLRDFPSPPRAASPDRKSSQRRNFGLSNNDKEEFRKAFAKHLAGEKKAYEKAYGRAQKLRMHHEPDERDLARLAWVLEKLNPKRVCVAALVSRNTLYLYANVIDEDKLRADMERLAAAVSDASLAKELHKKVGESLSKEQRTKKELKESISFKRKEEGLKKIAQRRTRKALRLVRKLCTGKGKTPFWQVHEPKIRNKHAEMRAADAACSGGFIGISKLCCGKCFLALLALKKLRINFEVQGAHFKTYASKTGWPIPNFLTDNLEAMKAFLGEGAYAIYCNNPHDCLKILNEECFDAPAFRKTDMVSSGEEYDDEGEEEKDSNSENNWGCGGDSDHGDGDESEGEHQLDIPRTAREFVGEQGGQLHLLDGFFEEFEEGSAIPDQNNCLLDSIRQLLGRDEMDFQAVRRMYNLPNGTLNMADVAELATAEGLDVRCTILNRDGTTQPGGSTGHGRRCDVLLIGAHFVPLLPRKSG